MSRPIRVLLVEDSESDGILLLRELKRNGYAPVSERVETEEAMTAALERRGWDVVVADYVLPKFSGPGALKLMQSRGLDLPFIIVSGHIDEDTAVASMKAGAHDYVMKDRLTRLVPAIEREMNEAETRRARRKSETEFVREQTFRRTIEDSIPSGIAAVDAEGKLTYVNPAFCELVGWSESELLGLKSPFPFFPPGETKMMQRALDEIAADRAAHDGYELRFQHRNGKIFDVLLLLRPFKDAHGKLSGWLGSATDITQRKHAEEALRRAHDELEQRVRERTADLVSANQELEKSISERKRLESELLDITEKERRRIGLDLHDDLGQRLAGISLMMKGLEVVLRKKKAPEAQEAEKIATLITQTVDHASNLAHDMAVSEAPEKDLASALGGLVHDIQNLFKITIQFKVEGKIPVVEKNVVSQLYKITQESITNAVKHGKAKQVTVQLERQPKQLVLTIRNNGLPFPSMIDQKKGMGLRIMNYRANTVGATLEVKPAKPKGAVVTAVLPLAEE